MQVTENMVGYRKRLGEYPTLSAIFLLSFRVPASVPANEVSLNKPAEYIAPQ
jgi:hypothetical protein